MKQLIIFLIFLGVLSLLPARGVTLVQEPLVIDALDRYIEELIRYECKDCPEDYSIIDVNGKRSYGCLQFQAQTFLDYSIRYGLVGNSIVSCEDQKILARTMFLDDPGAWRHWWTSVAVRGLGLPPEL